MFDRVANRVLRRRRERGKEIGAPAHRLIEQDGELHAYTLRLRKRPPVFTTYKRAWELLCDGLAVGFYRTRDEGLEVLRRIPGTIRGR